MFRKLDDVSKDKEGDQALGLPKLASLSQASEVKETSAHPRQGGTALVLKGEKVDLSYMYDGITLYPKVVEASGIDRALTKCRKEIRVFLAGDSELKDPVNAALFAEQTKTKHCIGRVKEVDGITFERGVIVDDDDHDFYHQDAIDANRIHHHLKFKQALTQAQFAKIVHVFFTEQLISYQQEQAYVAAFRERNAQAATDIKELCMQDKIIDGNQIKDWIATCENNDVLVHIHAYLLSQPFDYLREQTADDNHSKPDKQWQGTNQECKVVATSGTWAMLEKAFSLQMITNLRQRSKTFSRELGKERSLQFAACHVFFGIKRSRATTSPQTPQASHLLEAFSEADVARLNRQHEKVFGY